MSTYVYRLSGPERFQQLVQALLLDTYPELWCFPVGETDGGRDAYDPKSKTVAQVKFRRHKETVTARSVIAELEDELEKIDRLAERGAENYLFVTNAKGTHGLDTGVRDKVNAWMQKNVRIPSSSLWRDDLDRRVDRSSLQLRLRYSEILPGDGVITALIESAIDGQRRRRMSAIKAYCVEQYKVDAELKFKQVEQNNDLLALFVDVPIGISISEADRVLRGHDPERLPRFVDETPGSSREWLVRARVRGRGEQLSRQVAGAEVGAAAVLLRGSDDPALRHVVIQGAPGQGKSTVAQYVCQVHRARLLKSQTSVLSGDFLGKLDPVYRAGQFRLPFKIDARDLSRYLEDGGGQQVSLELFLAKQVAMTAGGLSFTADDLWAVLTATPGLIFVDGLDEVADLNQRRRLVEALDSAITRFLSDSIDMQIAVTSRPSLFGNAPSFATHNFLTVDLDNLPPSLATTYVDRWVEARRITAAEASSLRTIFEEKLALGHTADLARNPMQLTILLALIHRVGHSLPDKRTALYWYYVDLFVTREAEKSPEVRDNRAVLLAFIQHLAWLLQIDAETNSGSGAIDFDDLLMELRKFLLARQLDPGLMSEVFQKGVERIYVLVERIEGQYEFEVQPLREYFCARYIYETAPGGTFRNEAPAGDKGSRFEVLARIPFWSNVTRFYAGSYEVGEVADLVLSVEHLLQEPKLEVRLQVRRISFALLQDRVFASKRYAQDRLIHALCDAEGLEQLAAEYSGRADRLILDDDCGRAELAAVLFEAVRDEAQGRRASILCQILSENSGPEVIEAFVDHAKTLSLAERSLWLTRMARAAILDKIEPALLWDLLSTGADSPADVGNRCAYVLGDSDSAEFVVDARVVESAFETALVGDVTVPLIGNSDVSLCLGMLSTSGLRYLPIQLMFHPNPFPPLKMTGSSPLADKAAEVSARIVGEAAASLTGSDRVGYPSLSVITSAYDNLLSAFGDSWGIRSLAIASGSSRASSSLKGVSARGLSLFGGDGLPFNLPTRVALVARRRTAGPWRADAAHLRTEVDILTWLASVFSAAPGAVIRELLPRIEEFLETLAGLSFARLLQTVEGERRQLPDSARALGIPAGSLTSRALLLLSVRSSELRPRLTDIVLSQEDLSVSGWLERQISIHAAQNLSPLDGRKVPDADVDAWIEFCSVNTSVATATASEGFHGFGPAQISLEAATRVLNCQSRLPVELSRAAFRAVSKRYRPTAVSSAAKKDNWTFV